MHLRSVSCYPSHDRPNPSFARPNSYLKLRTIEWLHRSQSQSKIDDVCVVHIGVAVNRRRNGFVRNYMLNSESKDWKVRVPITYVGPITYSRWS